MELLQVPGPLRLSLCVCLWNRAQCCHRWVHSGLGHLAKLCLTKHPVIQFCILMTSLQIFEWSAVHCIVITWWLMERTVYPKSTSLHQPAVLYTDSCCNTLTCYHCPTVHCQLPVVTRGKHSFKKLKMYSGPKVFKLPSNSLYGCSGQKYQTMSKEVIRTVHSELRQTAQMTQEHVWDQSSASWHRQFIC